MKDITTLYKPIKYTSNTYFDNKKMVKSVVNTKSFKNYFKFISLENRTVMKTIDDYL